MDVFASLLIGTKTFAKGRARGLDIRSGIFWRDCQQTEKSNGKRNKANERCLK